MSAFLLLVLLQVSTGRYDTKLAPMPSMAACLTTAAELAKQIPPQPGISYSLTCITVRATEELPA